MKPKASRLMLLDDATIKAVLMAFFKKRQNAGIPEDEIKVVLGWANCTQVMYALLHMVKTGQVLLDVKDGEVAFSLAEK